MAHWQQLWIPRDEQLMLTFFYGHLCVGISHPWNLQRFSRAQRERERDSIFCKTVTIVTKIKLPKTHIQVRHSNILGFLII